MNNLLRAGAALAASLIFTGCASHLSEGDKSDLIREIRAASVRTQVTPDETKGQTFASALSALTSGTAEAPAGGGELSEYDRCVLRGGGYAPCDEQLKGEVP